MSYTVSLRTTSARESLIDRVRTLAAAGPFRVSDPAPVGGGTWTLRLDPARPEIAVGFAKVAELLVLLSREFEVQAVEGQPSRALPAAS